MSAADLAIIAGLVFAWGTVSARLERFDMTAPLTFTAAGALLTHGPLAVLGVTPSRDVVKVLAEATLALVLFCDASRVGPGHLKADLGLFLRVLGIGLPLTIALGTLVALALVTGDPWLALLMGAALAPTDAALGAGVMVNPAVPARIRRLINVESGLNDGIATPVVSVAIAGAGTAEQVTRTGPGVAVAEVMIGLAIGVVIGWAGGWLVRGARRRGWVAEGFAGAAVLGLAICLYATAVAAHGNGFIAAFAGGLAFASAGHRRGTRLVPFAEETGAMVSLLVWLMFGMLVIGALQSLTWQMVVYAVASLTVIRMVPVAVALAGAGPRWRSWAGSAPAAWRRSSSRCWCWRTCVSRWPGPPSPSSLSPCWSAWWRTGSARSHWRTASARGFPRWPRVRPPHRRFPMCLSAGSYAAHRPRRRPGRTEQPPPLTAVMAGLVLRNQGSVWWPDSG